MARIVVIGGTGYAGSNIVHEAAARGHEVTVVTRKEPKSPLAGVTYAEGSLLDAEALAPALKGADVVVVAVSPRGDMFGKVRESVLGLVKVLEPGTRLGVVGGAGGALVAPGGPRVVDAGFPEAIKPEALEMIDVLEGLTTTPDSLDWFYIRPAGGFSASNPGEHTGHYRDGGDLLVVDAEGKSYISGADFGVAVVDEIENAAHHRAAFSVGY